VRASRVVAPFPQSRSILGGQWQLTFIRW
jgi:hypothetical protein